MTQPIQPDRNTASIPDRDRQSAAARAAGTRSSPAGGAASGATPGADTAEIGQASALLRNAATPAITGVIDGADEARALAGRIAEALRANASHAVQAYAGIDADTVQALLAKA